MRKAIQLLSSVLVLAASALAAKALIDSRPEVRSDQRVNKILFDYKNLSRVERDWLARMFPFYRWTRKNIALQAERLLRNPGQAGIQAKLR